MQNVTQYILDLDRLYSANYHSCPKGYNSDYCNKKSDWKIKSSWIKWGDLAYTCI